MVGAVAARNDAEIYNRLLVNRIRQEHQRRSYDLCLWMGDYAWGSVPGLPTVSFVQGPPGTDARSVLRRGDEVARLGGRWQTLKWTTLARLRLSRLGLPRFHHSDHFIVGSEQSRRTLGQLYGIDSLHVSVMPYPIDLKLILSRPERTSLRDWNSSSIVPGTHRPEKTFGFISSRCGYRDCAGRGRALNRRWSRGFRSRLRPIDQVVSISRPLGMDPARAADRDSRIDTAP